VTNPTNEMSEQQIDRMIGALDSIRDGDLAVDMLIKCGKGAIPRLEDFLLNTPPRTIALPRCRAVRALGELGACSTLISYFKRYARPKDATVLFSEDAVRSAAARELARCPSAEVFRVLLDAAWQRVTEGLVLALSQFHRPDSVPLLFNTLEDDLCREEAMNSLRAMPDSVRQFGILSVRGLSGVTLDGPSAVRRQRATLQLLSEVGVTRDDWPDVRRFLFVNDPAMVLATAKIGYAVTDETEWWPEITFSLFKVAAQFDPVQEGDVEELLGAHPGVARKIAQQIATQKQNSGERPNWLSPLWRILNHTLDRVLETKRRRIS
jgi:hypothetical protein